MLTKHFVEQRGDKVGATAVGLGAQLAQLVRFVQQLHDPLLLREWRYGNFKLLEETKMT